jgi:hypothetical protein
MMGERAREVNPRDIRLSRLAWRRLPEEDVQPGLVQWVLARIIHCGRFYRIFAPRTRVEGESDSFGVGRQHNSTL